MMMGQKVVKKSKKQSGKGQQYEYNQVFKRDENYASEDVNSMFYGRATAAGRKQNDSSYHLGPEIQQSAPAHYNNANNVMVING